MNLEQQLSAVLSDPEAMNKISAIADSLGLSANQGADGAQSAAVQLPDLGGDNRTRLLMALKPFLSEKRAPYVDSAVAILQMMQLGKLGGVAEPLLSAITGKPKG